MKMKNSMVATMIVATAGTVAHAVPANDTSCAAIDISSIGSTATQFIVSDANQATEDADVSCNSTTGTQTAKYGVWYVYTAASNANIRILENSSNDVSISAWQGASCSMLTQITGACTDSPEDVVFTAVAGQTYYVLVNMWSNSTAPSVAGYDVSFTAFATPANDICTGATLVNSFPFSSTADQRGFTNDADVSCNSGTTGTVMGSWYRYDAAATGQVVIAETGVADTVLQLYTGSCGALVPATCTDTPESVTINAVAGNSYWVLVGRFTAAPTTATFFRGTPYTSSTDPFIVTAAQLFPPANDTCGTAESISTPYTGSVEIRAAGHDADVSCNDAANTELRRAVWYTYTPNANGTLFMNESTAADVVFAVYSGLCGSLVDVACTDGEPSSVALTSGTTYYIAVGMKSATAEPSVPLVLSFELVSPPANDTCGTAASLVLPSGSLTSDARVALNDPDITCNSSAASGAVAGVWYRINSGVDAGSFIVSETSANDVVLVLYSGSCGSLSTPIFCSDGESNVTAQLSPNTDYYLLVSQWGASSPTAPFAINYSFNAVSGACCNAGSCTILSGSACAAAGGTWQGANVACSGVLNSTQYDSTDAFPATIPDNTPAGITRSVTIGGTGETIDADGIAVTVNLNHTWSGDVVMTISNGTVTADLVRRLGLGVAGSTVGDNANYLGAYTFLDQSTNSIWATAATSADTLFNMPTGQYFASTTDGTQVSLGAAFNGQPLDGTWTLSVSDNANTDTGPLNGFRVQLAKFSDGPCPTGPTPCEIADFNGAGGVTADDIFAFLDAWFAQNGQTGANLSADANNDDAVTADDIFFFLDLWFTYNGQTCP